MANKILVGATYQDEIRAKLGVDDTVLSDTDIDARSVINVAENKVIASVTDWASLTDSDADFCYAAAVCMVAAVLAPSMTARIKKSKKDFDFSFENQPENWRARGIELTDDAYTLIGSISTQVSAETEMVMFGASGPTRANAPTSTTTIYDGDTYLSNV